MEQNVRKMEGILEKTDMRMLRRIKDEILRDRIELGVNSIKEKVR